MQVKCATLAGWILYHYTDLRGLVGMLTNSTLWASANTHLSDAAEGHYLIRIAADDARARVHRIATGADAGDKQQILLRALYELLGLTAKSMDANWPQSAYVACFSSQFDDLSQWRAYTKPAQGYCIGFDADLINDTWGLSECRYEGGEAEVARIQDRCEAFFVGKRLEPTDEILGLIERQDWGALASLPPYQETMANLTAELTPLGPIYKDPAFKDEREWRIIVQDPGLPMQLRAGQSLPIPYVELPFPDGKRMMREICIGPTHQKPALHYDAIQRILRQQKIRPPVMRPSRVPYRPW